jgi:DNA-binding response OmpR family regulator
VLKNVPVIMVSGRKSTEDIQRAMALGANDFIAKPFDVDFLINSIKKNIQSAS